MLAPARRPWLRLSEQSPGEWRDYHHEQKIVPHNTLITTAMSTIVPTLSTSSTACYKAVAVDFSVEDDLLVIMHIDSLKTDPASRFC